MLSSHRISEFSSIIDADITRVFGAVGNEYEDEDGEGDEDVYNDEFDEDMEDIEVYDDMPRNKRSIKSQTSKRRISHYKSPMKMVDVILRQYKKIRFPKKKIYSPKKLLKIKK